jgi:alpha-galactosidase
LSECVSDLFENLGMDATRVKSKIAGINHMAWLLEVSKDGIDLYPEIKRRAVEKQKEKHHDMVRLEMMLRFGYYITESSEHNAEYHPYFIKRNYPELIERYNIPLDEYPRRFVNQINEWKEIRNTLIGNANLP